MQTIIDRLTTYVPGTGEIGSATTTKYINISVSNLFFQHDSSWFSVYPNTKPKCQNTTLTQT